MKPDDATLIAEVRELDARATKGKWRAARNHTHYKVVWINKIENYSTLELEPDDADFIAAARTLLPDLANRLEAALKEIEDAPHARNCAHLLKSEWDCNCWKSRALNKPTKPTP